MTIWTILPRPTSDKNANKLRDIAFYGRYLKITYCASKENL